MLCLRSSFGFVDLLYNSHEQAQALPGEADLVRRGKQERTIDGREVFATILDVLEENKWFVSCVSIFASSQGLTSLPQANHSRLPMERARGNHRRGIMLSRRSSPCRVFAVPLLADCACSCRTQAGVDEFEYCPRYMEALNHAKDRILVQFGLVGESLD